MINYMMMMEFLTNYWHTYYYPYFFEVNMITETPINNTLFWNANIFHIVKEGYCCFPNSEVTMLNGASSKYTISKKEEIPLRKQNVYLFLQHPNDFVTILEEIHKILKDI